MGARAKRASRRAVRSCKGRVDTSELTVRLLQPAGRETLVGRGSIVRAGRRLCVVRMTVHSESGRLVATGSGSFMVSRRPIALPEEADG